MKKQRWIVVLACLLASLVWAPPAGAAVPLSVSIGKHAALLEGGQAVMVRVTVTCDPASGGALEAFVYVTQEGNESDFAFMPVQCNGEPETFFVTVPAFEESPFHRGKARASGYVLLNNDEFVSPTREIKIHKKGK